MSKRKKKRNKGYSAKKGMIRWATDHPFLTTFIIVGVVGAVADILTGQHRPMIEVTHTPNLPPPK